MIAQIKKQVTIQQVIYFLVIAGFSFIFTGLYLVGNSYNNKLFPNTYINSINVSGLSLLEGINVLENHRLEVDSNKLNPHEFTINIDDISLASSSADLGYTSNLTKAINEEFTKQHKNHPIINSANTLLAFTKKNELTASNKYDQDKLDNFLTQFNQQVELIGENPSVSLKISGSENSIVVSPGKAGREINTKSTTKNILAALQENKHQVVAKIASTSSVLNQEEIDTTIDRASKLVNKKLTLVAEDKKLYLDDQDLVELINPVTTNSSDSDSYSTNNIINLVKEWAEKINRPAQNAVFDYDEDTLVVEEFIPDKDGLELEENKSVESILAWIKDAENQNSKKDNEEKDTQPDAIENNNKSNKNLPDTLLVDLKRTQPEVTLESLNNLGIKERIGFGESYYHHSIINRIHNVGITAERISLKIVPPGEEFSFNKTIGEISSRTGYRSAYVISGGRTVLGDGGGVCQVSSTLFRSVLDAGLDVSKRLQHSYRVSYYELNSQPGFDATVYSGEVDFRFINDTPEHIVLLSYNNPEDLYMNIEIYGTNDGRYNEIHDYKKWGQVDPPATEYYPTSDLPTGVTKQIDWSVSGIKAEFTNTVRDKDGNVIHDDTYYSNYRPWSAKYLVGI